MDPPPAPARVRTSVPEHELHALTPEAKRSLLWARHKSSASEACATSLSPSSVVMPFTADAPRSALPAVGCSDLGCTPCASARGAAAAAAAARSDTHMVVGV